MRQWLVKLASRMLEFVVNENIYINDMANQHQVEVWWLASSIHKAATQKIPESQMIQV